MPPHRVLAPALAFFLLVAAVGCGSSDLVNDGGGSLGGSTGSDGGSGGRPTDGSDSFPCGNANCVAGREYCFSEEWNGAQKVQPGCRALPVGCSTCACAQSDAESVSLSCKATGTLTCINGMMAIDYNISSPTLTLACLVP